jgi:hypothetical protein
VVALAGCPGDSEPPPPPDYEVVVDTAASLKRDLDILFVIDNSLSMREEQANLAAHIPILLDVLDNLEGGLPSLHFGVVSSDMGKAGSTNSVPACSGGDGGALRLGEIPGACVGIADNYLSDVLAMDGVTRVTNYAGNLASQLGCAVALGDGGCGFEMHLEAMKEALQNPVNAGFIRPDAYLAVIILADEDDCSVVDPSFFDPESSEMGPLDSVRCFEFGVERDGAATLRDEGARSHCRPRENSPYLGEVMDYVDFLKGQKSNPLDIIVAGIIGNSEPVVVGRKQRPGQSDPSEVIPDLVPSCTYTDIGTGMKNRADPGVRLQYFFDQFPDRSTVTSICGDDFTDALTQVASPLRVVMSSDRCIRGTLVDADLAAEGLQAECEVAYVFDQGLPSESEQRLPACDAAPPNQPCWQLQEDPVACAQYPTGLALRVGGSQAIPLGVRLVARCRVE